MAEPRHLILPDGIVSSGWPSVRDTSAQVGIHYDPWQQELNRAMLAKDAAGLYAADTVAMSICRQSGKTYDVGGVTFADSIIHPGTTTVWTAHRFKVARESFNELRSFAALPKMAPHVDVDEITTAAGNECIPFRNGSRIVFAARERGAIRGFSKVRRLVLDEAQILTESAMADLAPTMNHAVNPQIILMGTPPKPEDPSEVFASIRDDALSGRSSGVLYVEFGADPDADLGSWEAVEQANPSFPARTGKRAILRLRKLLGSDDNYAREALGIWDSSGLRSVIDMDQWANLADAKSKPQDPVAFAVDMTPDRAFASIGIAGARRDGLRHVEVVDNGRGTEWVVDRAIRLVEKWGGTIILDASGPAGSLIPRLSEAGIEPHVISTREMGQACGSFYDAVDEKQVRHLDDPRLNSALGAARKRPLGDAWAWHRKDPAVDISPLVAVTLALFGLDTQATKKKRSGVVW